jgi:stage II sporulation protein D
MCISSAFSGHGVGLSGCGATALANQGKTFQEIIKYYYQGTEISQAR